MFFLNSDQVGMGGMHHPKSYCFDWVGGVGGGVGKSPPLLEEYAWELKFSWKKLIFKL